MTIDEAEDIADEQIAYWRRARRWTIKPGGSPMPAHLAWRLLRPGRPYPGGGWERVRAELIAVSLEMDMPIELRLAA